MNTILTLINNSFYNKRFSIRSLRLSVRTRGFHPRKRGSIPLGTAIMVYYVYLIKTVKSKINKTYVGYTNNLKARINKHNSNKGAKSTKGYKWILIFKKKFNTKSDAMKAEIKIKKDSKFRNLIKQRYIDNVNKQSSN